MSNIGPTSNCELQATDLSLNESASIAGNMICYTPFYFLSNGANVEHRIDGKLSAHAIMMSNPAVAMFCFPNSVEIVTASTDYIFTNVDDSLITLQQVQGTEFNYNSPVQGNISVPFDGFYYITGQLCFNSNTAGNIWLLNFYDTEGTLLPTEAITICREPASYTNNFIRQFNCCVNLSAGQSFSINLTNVQGDDVLRFGDKFQTSFLK